MAKTRHSFLFVWGIGSGKGADFAVGLNFYGYWPGDLPEEKELSHTKKIWKCGQIEIGIRYPYMEDSNTAQADIKMVRWPESERWFETLEHAMAYWVQLGAVVIWAGDELTFGTPAVFFPEADAPAPVYAVYSDETGLICNSGVDEEYEVIRNDQCDEIREILRGAGFDPLAPPPYDVPDCDSP